MKKVVRIVLIIILIAIAGAWFYWQYNKKHIIRNALESAISNKTDSLYYIHYDSSSIDEVSGSASFYNITLQSDSLQQQLIQFDTAAANSIYNVQIAEVSIRGANIPALLANEKVEANSIRIIRPVIYIISSGLQKKREFNADDTLAIYKKILGKFNSIKAAEIVVDDGQLHFTQKIDTPFVSLEGININLKNLKIDSTKDYANFISYFIKDVHASVRSTIIRDEQSNSLLSFNGLVYDAFRKQITLQHFRQINNENGKTVFDINKVAVKELSTDSFVLRKKLKAEELSASGGLLTFYSTNPGNKQDETIELDNNFFDEAILNKINLEKITINVFKKQNPGDPPFTLFNARFTANGIQNLNSGTCMRELVGKSNWTLAANGFSLLTANKMYKIAVGPFVVDKTSSAIHMDYFSVKPVLSEQEFVKKLDHQTDLYNITINNIGLTGVDISKLVTERTLIADQANINPVIKVFCDRTLPAFTGSKVGNYPHQLIQKLQFPLYIKKIIANNAYISYTERAAQSAEKGTVFFSNTNGTIENVTNIPAQIKKNNLLVVNANGKLLGAGDIQTKWQFPLKTNDGSFIISGNMGTLNTEKLNPLIEPLALASFKSGTIRAEHFSMNGNDSIAKGTSTLLYNDLKIEALKKDEEELKKKKLVSLFANLVIKDDNPKNGNTREAEIDIKRDTTRSFFNLVWQGLFKAAKRTALGKDDDK